MAGISLAINLQTAVDIDHRLIVSNADSDRRQLTRKVCPMSGIQPMSKASAAAEASALGMARQTRQNRLIPQQCADRGCYNGDGLRPWESHNITAYAPSHNKTRGSSKEQMSCE